MAFDWNSLNAAQKAAVQHIDGPLLILAGPGSGKTRVITHRIAYLLQQGTAARYILALTFTNKAAEEMQKRVAQLVPEQPVWMSTFHRFCSRLLRQYASLVGLTENFTIYDTDDSLQVLRAVLAEEGVAYTSPEGIARAISRLKNHLITPADYTPRPRDPLGPILTRVYPAYQQKLLACRAVDFDDLLLHVATLLRESDQLRAHLDQRYRYILVDEYQDTNPAQYAIVRALSQDYPNLAVTGDPDQSIYGWRGATLANILNFEKDYPNVRVVRLEQNYRSTPSILRVADTLIVNNRRRKAKQLFTENAEGAAVRLVRYTTHQEEADEIAARIAHQVQQGVRRPRDFAIFYRVNALSRTLEHALRQQGLPYQIVHGLEFYKRKEIKDVLAYLRLINNPEDDLALVRIINEPPRRIGKTTVGRLRQLARSRGLSLLAACRASDVLSQFAAATARHLTAFVQLIDRLADPDTPTRPVEQVLRRVLADSGYHTYLAQSQSDDDEDRLANIEELLTAAQEYDAAYGEESSLEGFLEQVSLVSDADEYDGGTDCVTLMTLHAAKGLEFPVVFIVAVEHGLVPHLRSRDDPDQLEEERRLLFVGITRAESELQFSWAQYREFRGRAGRTIPSEFLMELPRSEMDLIDCADVESWAGATEYELCDEDIAPYLDADGQAASTSPGDACGVGRPTHSASEYELCDEDIAQHVDADGQAAARSPGDACGVGRPAHRARPGAGSGDPRTARDPCTTHDPRTIRRTATPLATAAELAAHAPCASAPSPLPRAPDANAFRVGMAVSHPRYGLGKVVAVTGYGHGRTATVNFASAAGQKTFVIAKSPLQPIN